MNTTSNSKAIKIYACYNYHFFWWGFFGFFLGERIVFTFGGGGRIFFSEIHAEIYINEMIFGIFFKIIGGKRKWAGVR